MREYLIENFVPDNSVTPPSWTKCTKKLNTFIEKGWKIEHVTSIKDNLMTVIFYREKKTTPQLLND